MKRTRRCTSVFLTLPRLEVRAALGSPLLEPMFRTDRWDYVFRYLHASGRSEQRRVTIHFREDKVASIEAEGILQNLVVTAANDGTFHVEAGGRRLRALQLLRAEGRLRADLEQVPCRIVDEELAGEISQLLYWVQVMMIARGLKPEDVYRHL